jgi:double-stranded uracil-DNA glycosylase
MKTEQMNIRLEADLVAALERVAREEALDRTTAVRRLLEQSIRQWELERAVRAYQRGEVSLGRAAEESGRTQWELMDALRGRGVAYPLTGEQGRERLVALAENASSTLTTLPDIPPKPGGVLLVGINPAPVSVAAGHYFQGRLGQRLWRRLERLGLLDDPLPGAEDEAFARAGHGLTDLAKRPTRSSTELSETEFVGGVEALRQHVREWRPGLVLFVFKAAAARALGKAVSAGPGPDFEGVPTFLLSGPYAPKVETERIDRELLHLLGRSAQQQPAPDSEQSQPVTANDLAQGQIRLPRPAKRLLPSVKGDVEVVLRGTRVTASYDPRLGPDRERSAVLRVGRRALEEVVQKGERLRVSRGLGGVILLD